MTTDTTDRPVIDAPRASIEALLPAARKLIGPDGALPSRNKLKTELRIGAPKAGAIFDVLTREHQASAPETGTRLRLVTDTPDGAPAAPPKHTALPGSTSTQTPTPDPVTEPAPTVAGAPPVDAPVVAAPVAVARRLPTGWPVLLLALPAFVAIWSGWVGLGGLTGFGVVHPLPGIADGFSINSAITLPVGVETYAAYALRTWLTGTVTPRARRFAMVSAIGSLIIGAAGQVAYHLMTAAGMTSAPWPITTAVACLPVAVLGMGAALAHLQHKH
jgi:hypothetical protein